MRWYFASREKYEDKIKDLTTLLSKFNEEYSFEWTPLDQIKVYEDNAEIYEGNANKILRAMENSDIFVMITDEGGTAEIFRGLGLALSRKKDKDIPRIYLLGKYNQRSLMNSQPSINMVSSIEDVLEEECPEILTSAEFNSPKFFD